MTERITFKQHLFHPFTLPKDIEGEKKLISRVKIIKTIILAVLFPIISMPFLYVYTLKSKRRMIANAKKGSLLEQKIEVLSRKKILPPSPPQVRPAKSEKSKWIGIENFKSNLNNICWMNSAIKLLTISGCFNAILNVELAETKENANLITYQKAVRTLLDAMQNKRHKVIPTEVCRNFINASKPFFPEKNDNRMGQDQIDAYEYIIPVMEQFKMNSFKFDAVCLKTKIDEHGNETVELSRREQLEKIDFPQFASNAPSIKSPLVPNQAVKLEEVVSLYNDPGTVGTIPDEDKIFHFYRMQRRLVSKPDSIILNFNRTNYAVPGNKVNTNISLNLKGCIPFEIYSPNAPYSLLGIAEYKPKAVIMHNGNTGGGHYYLIECTDSGQYFLHNDALVKEMSKEEAEKLIPQGTYFGCTLEKFTEPD